MNKSLIATIVVVIGLIIGGAFVLANKSDKPETNTTPTASTTQTPATDNTADTSAEKPKSDTSTAATITYSDSGFSPSTLTVKAGTKVTIKNTSSTDMQFESDPHPTHTANSELNVGVIAAGQSSTMTLTKTGTHGYHNHLDSSQTGTIVVQ